MPRNPYRPHDKGAEEYAWARPMMVDGPDRQITVSLTVAQWAHVRAAFSYVRMKAGTSYSPKADAVAADYEALDKIVEAHILAALTGKPA